MRGLTRLFRRRVSAIDLAEMRAVQADFEVVMQRRAALMARLVARYELHGGEAIDPRDGTIQRAVR